MKWSTEAKVGAFTLAAGGLFVYTMLFLNHTHLFPSHAMEIIGAFQSVKGLKDGNGVRYSGVAVGKVKDIEISEKGVVVKMEIEKDVFIPEDSQISLQSDGLLGEKYVAITPGHSNNAMKHGAVVMGDSVGDVDRAVEQMNLVMLQTEKLLESMNRIMGDKETQEALKSAIYNANVMSKNMVLLTGQMNSVLANNQQELHVIASNMAEVSLNMNSLVKQLDASMQALDGDGASTQNVRTILANMQETTMRVNSMVQSLEGLVTDPKNVNDIQTTIHHTAQLTSALSTITGGGAGAGITTDVRGEVLYNLKKEKYTPNFLARIYGDKNVATIGVSNVGEGSRIELTGGKFIAPHVSARLGFIEGDVGAAIDYGWKDRPMKFTFALMNPNDMRYLFRTELRLGSHLYGVAQFNGPFHKASGGNYYGISYQF